MHSSVEQPSGHTSTNEAPRSMKKALVRPAPDEGGNHTDEGGNQNVRDAISMKKALVRPAP